MLRRNTHFSGVALESGYRMSASDALGRVLVRLAPQELAHRRALFGRSLSAMRRVPDARQVPRPLGERSVEDSYA